MTNTYIKETYDPFWHLAGPDGFALCGKYHRSDYGVSAQSTNGTILYMSCKQCNRIRAAAIESEDTSDDLDTEKKLANE